VEREDDEEDGTSLDAAIAIPSGAALRPEDAERLSAEEEDVAQSDAGGDGRPEDPPGTSPLWEWCRELVFTAAEADALPADAWGVYSAEQNGDIERAFRAGRPSAVVELGVREFHVAFDVGDGYARQVDPRLRKKRMVRRRAAPEAEARAAMQRPAATSTAPGREVCAICFASFAETATMPAIEVPGCRHAFHRVCVQQLADRGAPCPCCRGAVDWPSLVPALQG